MLSVAQRLQGLFLQRFAFTGVSTGPHAVSKIIEKITEVSAPLLVPEICLHLITRNCELWRSRPELCPVPDPYWAFVWPGGQALCRYLLDNPMVIKNKNVLDIGSGAGATVIAAINCGATTVLANDIDPIAITAIKMNLMKNISSGDYHQAMAKVACSVSDIIPKSSDDEDTHLDPYLDMCKSLVVRGLSESKHFFDVVLIGDMFYDEDVASRLFTLVRGLKKLNPEISILIGDPGRHAFLNVFNTSLKLVTKYDLPKTSMEENYGFNTTSVYSM